MEKEFSRNIGDIVWVMYSNKAVSGHIYKIKYSKVTSSVSFNVSENTTYGVKTDNSVVMGDYTPNELFSTKEELLNSL